MSSINDYKINSIDSHYLSQEFDPNNGNLSTTSSPYYVPISTRSMSSMSTPMRQSVDYQWVPRIGSTAVRNNTVFSSFDSQSSPLTSGQPMGTTPQNFETKYENKILIEYLDHLRQNNLIFQTNILKELKQMRELMADMKNSIEQMPIRFADNFNQCLDSINSRSESLSVVSEPEIIDIFDKIDVTNDCSEDTNLVEFCDKSDVNSKQIDEKSGSVVDKFVFEYNPYIDLDKWLKKD